MHTDLLQNVGLAKNEARIYETLLELGESTVGQIAARTEGWKNYIRDIIRIGKDVFAIGAKAPLNNPRLRGTLELLRKDIESRKIRFYNLYDAAVKGTKH